MNYYRRYIGDYQRDTMHLSLLEHGAYTMLLDSFYAQDGNLPESHTVLFRLCRATSEEEKDAVRKVADEFFPTVDGKRANGRGVRELDAAIPRIQSAKENGKKGGRPAKAKPQQTETETQPVSEKLTHAEPDAKAIQPPATNPHPPAANHQPPVTEDPIQKRSAGAKPPRTRAAKAEAPTAAIWMAYAEAYAKRYTVAPTRNASVNGKLANFAARVPIDEAPHIAAFYVGSNREYYVRMKHSVGVMLRDAESLRTEWLTGRQATDTEAKLADRTAATGNVFRELIDEFHPPEAAHGTR